MPVIEEEPVTRQTPTTAYDRTRYETTPERPPVGPGPMKFMAGGAVLEAVAGLAAVILAIIGLSGTYVTWMAAISTIIVGFAFLVEGATFAAPAAGTGPQGQMTRPRLSRLQGGLMAVFMGGLAGVVLGILAILGIIPAVLVALAAIILGATLVLTTGPAIRLGRQLVEGTTGAAAEPRFPREAIWLVAGFIALIGVGSLVLGIIGLAGYYPVTLSLVAMLALGFCTFVIGTAFSDRLLRSLDRGNREA